MTTAVAKLLFRPGALHRIHEPAKRGQVEILIESPDSLSRIRAALCGQSLVATKYTRLLIDGQLWMTDAEFEHRTNSWVYTATGDVLIGGLGLGFVLPLLLVNKSVSSVTVLELSPDVIHLVAPQLKHKKLSVIQADVLTWEADKGTKYNCIFLDIWPNVPNGDDRKAIIDLKLRYRRFQRTGGWTRAWCEDFTR